MNDGLIIITGASTGIGRATAIEFGKTGKTVGLLARRLENLEETKRLVETVGGRAEIFQVDLSKLDAINKLIETIKQKTKHITAIVNVAGIWHGENEVYAGKNLEDFNENVVVDTLMVGSIVPLLLVHGLLPLMTKGGFVLNLSGTFSNGAKGWLPYYVSKRSIEDLTVGLAEELKDKDIKVNCISPSDTATEQYKKYFPDDAEDAQSPEAVAKYFVELSKMNISGKIFVIKNGQITEGYHK